MGRVRDGGWRSELGCGGDDVFGGPLHDFFSVRWDSGGGMNGLEWAVFSVGSGAKLRSGIFH
jgi:hypothetical protein